MATSHVVRPGETLDGIARRYQVSVRSITEANGIANPNRIQAGSRLEIPSGSGPSSQGDGAGDGYEVRRGDTLASIARRFGSSIRGIADANAIANPNRIAVGQKLVIPRSGGGAASGGSGGGGGSGNPDARYHVVRPGESLATIAARYGVPAAQIAEANGIVDGRVYANARVFLEPRNTPAATTGAAGSTVSHTVRPGENLAAIAARYGSSVSAIVSANGIADPNRIVAGRTLSIPTGRGASMQCPVPGSRYMNDWGFPRSGGRYHDGNDLFAPRGTPILAPVSGRLEQVSGAMGGNQFRLFGDDGTTYIGSHMDRYGAAGHVGAGAVIGYVGNSGNARGGPTHLHFEIRPRNGPSVNPYPSLRSAC